MRTGKARVASNILQLQATAVSKVRKTAVDGAITRHEGYVISQRIRKRIEEAFGWAKTIGGIAKLWPQPRPRRRRLHLPNER